MPQANELIVQFLQEAGIDAVFGIPGGGTGQIFARLVGWVAVTNFADFAGAG